MSLNPHEWSYVQFAPVKPLTSPFITKFKVSDHRLRYAMTFVFINYGDNLK